MKYVFYFIALFVSMHSSAQINGNCNAPYNTPESLIDILIGEGVEYSNVSYSGFDCSAGFFDGTSNIGFASGLVMATDGVESITPGGFGGGFGGAGVDVDLTEQLTIVGASATNLNNLIVLEFDFIPTSDVVTFEYVFASNEYPGYTCSQFNDIFGFFLSGPGIAGPFSNGAENIALVPDPDNPTAYTTTPVIINTINSGVSSSGNTGPCDDIDPNWQDYSIFFTDNGAETTVSYPGFTVPLVATANVTACETYHIKLAIADVADGALNSAVFLQENSFNSPPPIEYTVESNTVNIFNSDSEYIDNLYEGCGTALVTFERPNAVVGDIVFDFIVSGSATETVDYSLTNATANQIVMEDGALNVSLEVLTINDLINEGIENLMIQIQPVDYGCYESDPDTIIFEIHDQPELFVDISDDILLQCPGDEADLSAIASGGVGGLMESPFSAQPYVYDWFGLGDGADQIVVPTEPTTYCVNITDVCDQQISACVFVDVQTYEELIVSSELVYLCEDVQEQLCSEATGGNNQLTYSWSNGDLGPCIIDYHNVYTVTVTDGCGIQSTATGEIYLDEAPDPVFTQYQIPEDNFGIEIINYTSNLSGLSFLWDFGDQTGSVIENPENHFYEEWGEYYITLGVTTELNNCYKEVSQLVQVAPLYYFYAPNTFTPNGDLVNDTFGPSVVGNETYEIFIFDRWGKQVFYSNDLSEKWDGSFESTEAMIGAYVFKVVLTKPFDTDIYEEYGVINLVR